MKFLQAVCVIQSVVGFDGIFGGIIPGVCFGNFLMTQVCIISDFDDRLKKVTCYKFTVGCSQSSRPCKYSI